MFIVSVGNELLTMYRIYPEVSGQQAITKTCLFKYRILKQKKNNKKTDKKFDIFVFLIKT